MFAPPGSPATPGPEDRNTWCGFGVEPVPGDWTMMRFHIREVICGGNEEYERWAISGGWKC